MTVSFTHSQTETRMNRCMQRIPTAIRPDKQEFLKNAINLRDGLVFFNTFFGKNVYFIS